MTESRCDECDPSFGCFLEPSKCRKPPMELTLEQARLAADCCKDACGPAFDEIATLCGCPTWEYPGQVIRDVQGVVAARDKALAEVTRLEAECRQRVLWPLFEAACTERDALRAQVHEERSLVAEQQTAIQHLVEQLQVAERERDEAVERNARIIAKMIDAGLAR